MLFVRLAVPLALLVALLAAPAAGQDRAAIDEEARQIFEAGQVAFGDGRYDAALSRFRESYELSGRAELLYNIGLCLDRLRRDAEAIESYEDYLTEIPDAENRADVEQRIAAMRAAGLAAPPSTSGSTDVGEYWWAFALGGLAVAAAIVIPIALVTTASPEGALPGDFGPGGVIVALEVRP